MSDLKSLVRIVEGFPNREVSFKDISSVLADGPSLRRLIDEMVTTLEGVEVDIVVGPEARGFLVGMPLAYALGAGFVPARRPGKLPPPTRAFTYSLEYGVGVLEIYRHAIKPGMKVAIVDDLLATGGTVQAVASIIEALGGTVVACCFAIELLGLGGRELLTKYDVKSVVQFQPGE